jgi:hypothetical protein
MMSLVGSPQLQEFVARILWMWMLEHHPPWLSSDDSMWLSHAYEIGRRPISSSLGFNKNELLALLLQNAIQLNKLYSRTKILQSNDLGVLPLSK